MALDEVQLLLAAVDVEREGCLVQALTSPSSALVGRKDFRRMGLLRRSSFQQRFRGADRGRWRTEEGAKHTIPLLVQLSFGRLGLWLPTGSQVKTPGASYVGKTSWERRSSNWELGLRQIADGGNRPSSGKGMGRSNL